MYPLPLRLLPGEDLREQLQAVVRQHGVEAGFVLNGAGSLSVAFLRLAGAQEARELRGDLELLSLSGSIATNGVHLHASVSDAEGRVLGGHLCPGSVVRTTVEVLLAALPEHRFSRETDAATGYLELAIQPGLPAQEVLDFWFGAAGSQEHGRQREAWFRKSESFDAEIAVRFAPLIESALTGGLREWEATPRGALARILLLDQFTRTVFRGTPRAFAGDAQALESARRLVDSGRAPGLAPLERSFVYMPYEHAEDAEAQRDAVRLFTALATERTDLAGSHDYPLRHKAAIDRFGRFPHRNQILGRESTPTAIEFLKQAGSRF